MTATRGLAVDGQFNLGRHWSFGWVYTYLSSRDTETDQALPLRPKHMATAWLRFHHDALGIAISLDSRYVSKRTYTTRSRTTATLDPYFLMNLSIRKRFRRGVAVVATVHNIWNTDYQAIPTSGELERVHIVQSNLRDIHHAFLSGRYRIRC